MTTQHITRTFALNLLNDIVKDKGPNTEATCRYVTEEGDAPLCIVGHALSRLGVPLPVLSGWEGESADNVLPSLEMQDYFEIDDDAIELLTDAQSHQDSGHHWGEAVVLATELLTAEEIS